MWEHAERGVGMSEPYGVVQYVIALYEEREKETVCVSSTVFCPAGFLFAPQATFVVPTLKSRLPPLPRDALDILPPRENFVLAFPRFWPQLTELALQEGWPPFSFSLICVLMRSFALIRLLSPCSAATPF